ncbi:MAG: helix-turn-helix transcriptional regulator [Clostridia bacterium]|nr:helix-turn-helix transcriptional regulator [Clostridia bacterium]
MSYSFGNYICELREKANLTQTQLGEKLGVSNKAVSKWENGAAYPSSDLMYDLAKVLDTSVEELYRVMSETKKEKGKLRAFLDKVFGYPKIEIPFFILISIIVYILFIAFGKNDDKSVLLIATPVICVILGAFVYLINRILIKMPMVSSRFIDILELFMFFSFMMGETALLVAFFIDMKNGFNYSAAAVPFALAAIVMFHNKRKR